MSVRQRVTRILDDVIKLAASEKKLTGFCIGNTRKEKSTGLYFTPIRNTIKLVAGSVIVYSVEQAKEIAAQVDGKVDYVFVDTEKKVSASQYASGDIGNVERAVREVVEVSKILTFKGNDITVNAIDALLERLLVEHPRGLGGKKATIIGAGNIGSKLALKLVERGMEVVITRRHQRRLAVIVEALNIIKPMGTFATISGTSDNIAASKDADVLIGLTAGAPTITPELIEMLSSAATVIDVGKGCLTPQAIHLAHQKQIPIYRASIGAGFEGYIATALETENIINNRLGRKEICGVPMVSGGLLGAADEVVVDNVFDPTAIFGMANGVGDFVYELNSGQKKRLDAIQKYIDRRALS